MSSSEESPISIPESLSSDKLVAYYLKHTKNRDIKRFMRLGTNHHPSKATSEDDNKHLAKSHEGKQRKTPPLTTEAATEQSSTKASADQTPVVAPDSSTKYARRLEWDSLGDVGYKKSNSTGNLSTLERSVLKEFYQETPSEPELYKQSSDSSTPAIKCNATKNRRERWRQTLETLSKKYSSTSASVDTQDFTEQPHSTPKLFPTKDQSCQTSLSKLVPSSSYPASTITTNSSSKQTVHPSSSEDSLPALKGVARSIQTSFIVENADKFCQTSFERINSGSEEKVDEFCQTSFDGKSSKSLDNTEKSCQTSFDQIATAKCTYLSLSQPSLQQQTIKRRVTEKPAQPMFDRLPRRPEKTPVNRSYRADSFATQSSFEYRPGSQTQLTPSTGRSVLTEVSSNTTSKSKASSDSDKENQATKKPPTVHGESDIELGVQLLCSLVESKSLSASHKRKLAKKIFEKIMKQRWNTPSSVSLTSRSSTISTSSLIENSQPSKDAITAQAKVIPTRVQSQTDGTKSSEIITTSTTTPTPSPEPVTMREWLHPLTRSEREYDKQHQKTSPQAISPQTTERQKQLSWIDTEINRLEGLKNLLIQERQPKPPTPKESTDNTEECYERTTHITRSLVIYDEPATSGQAEQPQPEKVVYKTTKVIVNGEECTSSSDSRKNRRSKLETPTTSSSQECQSVSAFADQLQKQFMDNYLKKERERCASEHYSEPRVCGKQVFTRNPSYTSVASSAFCMSSEMSIPVVDSTSSSTTTHQYESHQRESVGGVAVQTTCSIIRTTPIFGPRCKCVCICGRQCKCACVKPTIRLSGQVYHQTVQVKPKSIAYVIRFNDSPTNTDSKSDPTVDTLSLQQQLERQHPDFTMKANRRREILQKLHQLRQEREKQIREIAESSNNSSLSRKLEELPPPPIKHIRVCPTREMKHLTQKRYSRLPEVVAKKEREKLERRKKTTRLITHIFNKKLQRLVHKGKLSLEYSRTVI